MKNKNDNYLEEFIFERQAVGQLSFSLQDVSEKFDLHSADAIKLSLNRLSKKIKYSLYIKVST